MYTKYIEVHRQTSTPQPLYNTIVGVHVNFRVSNPNRVIWRVKCIVYIGNGVLNGHLGSNLEPCYIQNGIVMNRVIKRFRCLLKLDSFSELTVNFLNIWTPQKICCNHPKS